MDEFINRVQQLTGYQISNNQLSQLTIFERELQAWNEKVNLTAIRTSQDIWTKHFLDSISCLLVMGCPSSPSLIDIGTGAGFPGIPLKLIFPNMHLTLVESIGKKADFCRYIVKVLNLENVEVLTTRAEELGQQPAYRESFDWAVARAVSELKILAEYLLPLVKIGGYMLAQKGESAQAELASAASAIKILGGAVGKITPVEIPDLAGVRYLITVNKTSRTPLQFPRKPGIPAKKPL
jgi:16S rRNA (guanine527-N7)-methyltransferase